MERGNGSAFMKAAPWVALAVSLLINVLNFARDTPTRGEMEAKIAAVEARQQPILNEISSRLARIEGLMMEDRRNANR